jgi:uncharacterized membrane protein HdeD (DUF308 family)
MTNQFWLVIIGVLILLIGLWKAFQPMWWVNCRRRYPWYDKLELYSFLYKGARAEKTVRLNGYALIVIGLIVLVSVSHEF